mgnify:CR=1 FL=1
MGGSINTLALRLARKSNPLRVSLEEGTRTKARKKRSLDEWPNRESEKERERKGESKRGVSKEDTRWNGRRMSGHRSHTDRINGRPLLKREDNYLENFI